jgi:zinc protease
MDKKKVTQIILIFSFILLMVLFQEFLEAGEPQFPTKYLKLKNGLQVFLEKNDRVPLVHIGFSINVGSRDETAETSGFIHIMEHLVFSETAVDSHGKVYMKEARRRGLHMNAFTGRDVMSLEMTAPAEQLEFALGFVFERIFNLKLDKGALEREKEVILEELAGKKDDPFQLGLSLLYQEMFSGHSYGRPIGGVSSTVKTATVKALEKFAAKYLFPSNCAIAVVGNFDFAALEQQIKQVFGTVGDKENNPKNIKTITNISRLKKNVSIERKMDTGLGHLFIGFWAPARKHKDVLTLRVLTHILGSGANPLLYNYMAGAGRLVENIGMGYNILEYGGALVIKLTAEPEKIKKARKKLFRFLLKEAKTFSYSPKDDIAIESERLYFPDYLESAKNKMLFNDRIAREDGLQLAVGYSRRVLFYGEPKSGDFKARLNTVDALELRLAAEKYLSGQKYVAVTVLPDEMDSIKRPVRRK